MEQARSTSLIFFKKTMNIFFIGLEIIWLSILVITGVFIMRLLNDKGIKETTLIAFLI